MSCRAKRRVGQRRLFFERLEKRLVLSSVQLGAAIAGNVADADNDTFGDNANALPGSTSALISSGIFQSGGPGSNGTVRMHMEWNISSLTGPAVDSAQVLLHTNRGTVDLLDTFFFYATVDGNGALENSDFETPATQISGFMPVPVVPNGTDGTFLLDVTDALQSAIGSSFTYFVLQGRVNESLAGPNPQRGLQVRSTATSNAANLHPQLIVNPVDLAVSVIEPSDPVVAGSGAQNMSYIVTLTNHGPSDASGVAVSVDLTLPAGVTVDSVTPDDPGSFVNTTAPDGTWTVDVPSGASTTLTIVLTVDGSTADGIDVISISAAATASASEIDNNLGNNTAAEATTVIHVTDLAVSVTESVDPVLVGFGSSNLAYVVTVTNVGSVNATGVEVTDVLTLPAGTTVSSVTPSAGTSFSDPTWSVGTLFSSATTALTAAITDTDTSIVVDDSSVLPTVDGNATTVDFHIIIDGEEIAVRDVVGNTLAVNRGINGTTADAHVIDSLVRVSTSATLTIVLTVSPATAAGTGVISTTASLSAIDQTESDPNDTNDLATETTSVTHAADVSVSVSESADPVTPGSNLTYVVTIENVGEFDATGVELQDFLTLPDGVSVSSITPSAGTFSAPTWSLGNLASDATATLTIVLDVGPVTVAGADVISNSATLSAINETDVNGDNNADTEATSVAGGTDLSVSVIDSSDPVVAGSGTGNLTYVVTVANVGADNATGVELEDILTLPSGVSVYLITPSAGTSFSDPTWTVGTLPSGASATLTIVLTVDGTTAAGAGVIGNSATLDAPPDANAANNSAVQFTEILEAGSFIPIRISGTVFQDLNASAAFESGSDAPQSGVAVTLIFDGNSNGMLDDLDSDTVVDVQISAAGTGAYSFNNYGAGTYFVQQSSTGFVQTVPATSQYLVVTDQGPPAVTAPGTGWLVVAHSGVNETGRDFGNFNADAGGPYVVNENGTVQLDGSGGADFQTPPALAANLMFTWDLDGDGVFGETGTARGDETGFDPTFDAAGLTAPTTRAVALRVTGNFAQTDSATATVNVVRIVNEGAELTLTGAVPSGTESTRIDWDDGTPIESPTITGSTYSKSHTYADNGLYTVIVTFVDNFGSRTTQQLPVLANNVTPTLATLPNLSINEGDFITLPPATFSDPGFDHDVAGTSFDTFETFTATIHWGDGTTEQVGDITLTKVSGSPGIRTTGTIQASHAYADNGVYKATVTLLDDDGGLDFETFQVAVFNVAPTIDDQSLTNTACDCGATAVGDPVIVSVDFSDPGFDNPLNAQDPGNGGEVDENFVTSTITWDDGTIETFPAITVLESPGSEGVLTTGSVAGTHQFTTGGIFDVVITVRDDDGGEDSISKEAFVTGARLTDDGELQVVGTNGKDIIKITRVFLGGSDDGGEVGEPFLKVTARFNVPGGSDGGSDGDADVFLFAEADVQRMRIEVCEGDDKVTIGGSDGGIDIDALIVGDEGDDRLTGGDGNDQIFGGPGDDELKGTGGDDLLDGGEGSDSIWGGAGNDTITDLLGDNQVHSGNGNDAVTVGNGANQIWTDGGDDTVTAGNGNNQIYLGHGNNTVVVGNGNNCIWANGGSDGGSDGNNAITTGNGNNEIRTGGGNDTITTGNGNNEIRTGGGNATITTGDGNNEIRTGDGHDIITTGSGNDKIRTDGGDDTINAGDGDNDVSAGAGNDVIITGMGRDVVDAGAGSDVIRAGAGNDSVQGGSGNDILLGGDGDDLLIGGDGRDFLIGGMGADRIVGNQDEDLLIAGYTAHDANFAALLAILQEWTSGNSYITRVANITNGTGLTVGNRLVGDDGGSHTVFNDNDIDTLTGNHGQDWFFANRFADDGGVLDTITDKAANEFWNDTDF